MPPQLSLSRPLPVTSCVDAGLDSLCTKQDVASFRIQYIGVEGERIGPKAFGSGVQSLLVPSGYCYPRTFGDEQLRGCQSYSAIAAPDQAGFTLNLHWILLLLGFFLSSACLQACSKDSRGSGTADGCGAGEVLYLCIILSFDRSPLGHWLQMPSDVLVARSKRKNRRQDLLDRLFCPSCRNDCSNWRLTAVRSYPWPI